MKSIKLIFSVFALAFSIGAQPTSVSATTFQNGDFSSGLTGYAVRRCTFLCGPDTTGSATVANNAGDNFLQLMAPSFIFGLGQVEVSQTFSLTGTAPKLSFDAGIVGTMADPANQTLNGTTDFFSLLMRDGLGTLHSLFRLDASGASKAATAPDPSALNITPLSGSLFGFNLMADLSAFSGQNVTLIFTAVSRPDNLVTKYGVDNISFSGTPTTAPVPLPAGFLLMLTGLLSLVGLRRTGRSAV